MSLLLAAVLTMGGLVAVTEATVISPAAATTNSYEIATGHDMDYHCYFAVSAECAYLKLVVDRARGGSTLPILALDEGSELPGALTDAGYTSAGEVVTVNPANTSTFDATPFVDSGGNPLYSAIITASDSTCGGCDNDPSGETNINARATDFATFFNDGGGIVALAAAGNYSTYYRFLPIAVTGTTVLSPFTVTATGAALGVTSAMANCCPTHNSFVPPNSPFETLETDAAANAETIDVPGSPAVQPPVGGINSANVAGPSDATVANQCRACVGGPVDTSTGNQYISRNDLSVPGRGLALSLGETYNTTFASVNGPLGFGWSWSYGVSLTNPDGTQIGSSPSIVRLNEEGGAQDTFNLSGSTWAPATPRVDATLTHSGSIWTLVRRGTETLTFNSSGQLTGETDLNGDTTSITYPSKTQITIADPAGRTLTVTLNSHKQITQVVDAAARTVLFSYDNSSNLINVTDVDGGITSYGYDSSHRLVEERSPRFYATGALPAVPASCSGTPPANITTTLYDSSGRVSCQWDADGRKTSFAWVGDGLSDGMVDQATVTDPKGNVVVYNYTNGELTSETKGYGTAQAATSTYRYDPTTLGLIWTADPNGHITKATFDSHGNRLSVTDARQDTTTWTYNNYDEVASVTPPSTYGGQTATTTYSYDEPSYSSGGAGNLTTISTPILSPSGASEGTQATHYVHGNSSHPGDVTSMIDPDSNTWTYTYDSYGDKTSQTDPATSDNSDSTGSHQNVTKWAYNTNTGWNTAQLSGRYTLAHPSDTTCTPPAAGCTTYTHDNMGHVLITTDGNGHQTTNHFDLDGNRDYSIDADANKTSYTYDAAEQLTATTRPDTTTLKTNYWPDGTVEDQINGAASDTHYTYDALGHLTGVTDPDNRTTGYAYDAVGNLLVKADPGVTGCTTTSTTKGCTIDSYDAANHLIGINYNDPATPNVSYGYDANNRRTSMVDGTGTTSWSYDSLSRIASTTNGANATVSYGYDNKGQITSIVYPGTTGTLSRTYDADGRESSLTDWKSNTTTFSYNADGQLTSGTEPTSINGQAGAPVVDSYTYDPADVVSAISTAQGTTSLDSFTYGRDNANQVNSVTSTGVPADTHTYGYNPLNQLTGIDTNSNAYVYDPADNPKTLDSGQTQTFDPANQLTGSTFGLATTTYGFDSRGDRTSAASSLGASTTYTYDQDQRLTTVSTTRPQLWAKTVASGEYSSVALKSDGTVWSWGYNLFGQLGNGTTTDSHVPVQVSGLTDVTAVAAGFFHGLALKSDGTVWAWGDNASGELGNGTTNDSLVPVQVTGLSGVVAIAAGGYDSMALKSDGTVWAWGMNTNGQLGDGNTTDSSVPVQVTGLTGVTAITVAVGYDFSAALKSDGTVWAWGYNYNGELGNGGTTDSHVPVQVTNLSGITAISAGSRHTLALKSDGTVWAWGYNAYGQLGDGTNTGPQNCSGLPCSTVPVQVSNLTGVSTIASGQYDGLALKTDGTVWGWGTNGYGELGNGATTDSYVPVEASNLTSVTAVAGGAASTVALKSDGTVWAWGDNAYGQLGNGTTTDSHVPTQTNMSSGMQPAQDSQMLAIYAYNGNGLRMSKTVNGIATSFTYDSASSATPQLLADSSVSYVYGPDGLPLEEITNTGTVTWYHHDQLGSTRLITDASGANIGTATYTPYGQPTFSGVVPTFAYTGAYADPESGLLYLINRYYDPVTGQFLNRDPLTSLTNSPYTYAGDDPVNSNDPTGLWNSGVCDTAPAGALGGTGYGSIGGEGGCGRQLALLNGSAGVACNQNESQCPIGGSSPFDFGLCIGGNAGNGSLGVSLTFCIVDANGHVGSAETTGFGNTSTFGLGGSATAIVGDASTLNGLSKGFENVGGNAGPVAGDYQWGTDTCGNSVHVLAGGVGIGYEVHWGHTYTYVQNW